jgi:large subunit ribosomal protein L15
MPLVRRIPKRGFHNRSRVEFQVVNLRDLERVFDNGDTVSLELLVAKGLVNKGKQPVKILGMGELTKKLEVQAHKFSNTAQASIEKAGGSCEVVTL